MEISGWFVFSAQPHHRLRTAGSFEKETSARVAVASKPPYSFRRAFGSKNGGLEATATVFRQSPGKSPIQF